VCIFAVLLTTKNIMKIQITKLQKVEVPTEYQKEEGCIAFQLVKVVIDFYGKLIEDVLDTKILEDGRQIIKDGNGYIKAGHEI
jgi:hypothetical protein